VIEVSHGDRVVFPALGRTKADVVRYYERMGERILPHVLERPLSIKRYPKGLAERGFFQKNVPAHYPASIERFAVPRSRAASKKHPGAAADLTVYPLVSEAEQLAYLANQGAIELHVPTVRAPDLLHPDRLVLDLDPPPDATPLVQRAALEVRELLREHRLETAPVATGSKGYHIVAALQPICHVDELALAARRLAALLTASFPEHFTTAFRVALRGGRVYVDWLRLGVGGSVVAPYSLRATPRAGVATPLTWDELAVTSPDAFSIGDPDELLARPDPLLELASAPLDPQPFVASVAAAFEAAGLALEPFDRFRS
jgi:bifunctional non-homologous end joining protein LigD